MNHGLFLVLAGHIATDKFFNLCLCLQLKPIYFCGASLDQQEIAATNRFSSHRLQEKRRDGEIELYLLPETSVLTYFSCCQILPINLFLLLTLYFLELLLIYFCEARSFLPIWSSILYIQSEDWHKCLHFHYRISFLSTGTYFDIAIYVYGFNWLDKSLSRLDQKHLYSLG